MKFRGVMARRRDAPEFIRRAQLEMFDLLRKARTLEELAGLENELNRIYKKYLAVMKCTNPNEFFIRKRISRTTYSKNSVEAAAVRELKRHGVKLSPGMEIEYVVVDFSRKIVSVKNPEIVDLDYYTKLLYKAYKEVYFSVRVYR